MNIKEFPDQKVIFFQLAESLPFELLEEYRQIFSFFDRWSNDEARNDQFGDEWFDYDKLFDEGSSFIIESGGKYSLEKIQFKIRKCYGQVREIRNTHPKR